MDEIRQITIAELTSSTAEVFEQVKTGHDFAIMEDGHPVALLRALDTEERRFLELVAAGIAPPDLLEQQWKFIQGLDDNPPLPAEAGQERLSETIIKMREEERF